MYVVFGRTSGFPADFELGSLRPFFGGDGSVYESTDPVWDEARVDRLR